jgi:hypothetical protein
MGELTKVSVIFLSICSSLLLLGCATPVMTPAVTTEIPLADTRTLAPPSDPGKVKVFVFNASFPQASVPDLGKDVWFDGKGLAHVETGQYIEFITSPGKHTLRLHYQNVSMLGDRMLHAHSTHELDIAAPVSFIEICSFLITEGIKARVLLSPPEHFIDSFAPLKEAAPPYSTLRTLPFFSERLDPKRERGKIGLCSW